MGDERLLGLLEQLAELQMVESAFPEASIFDHGLGAMMDSCQSHVADTSRVDDGDDAAAALLLHLEETPPISVRLPLRVRGSAHALLELKIPQGYPKAAALDVSLREARDFPATQQARLLGGLNAMAHRCLGASEPCLFEVLQLATTTAEEESSEENEAVKIETGAEAEAGTEAAGKGAAWGAPLPSDQRRLSNSDDDTRPPPPALLMPRPAAPAVVSGNVKGEGRGGGGRGGCGARLSRRLIYSHHLVCPEKRRYVREGARALRLGGFVKHGWPALLLVEGAAEDVAEYVGRLKRFKWKHLAVRGEEDVCLPLGRADPAKAGGGGGSGDGSGGKRGGRGGQGPSSSPPSLPGDLDGLRALPLRFDELGDGRGALGEAGARCREAGLGTLFLTLFGGGGRDGPGMGGGGGLGCTTPDDATGGTPRGFIASHGGGGSGGSRKFSVESFDQRKEKGKRKPRNGNKRACPSGT